MRRIYTFDEFTEKYLLGEFLGQGAFGAVYMAKERLSNRICAIKQIGIENSNPFTFNSRVLTMDSEANAWTDFYDNIGEVMTAYIDSSDYLVKIYDYFIVEGKTRNTSTFCLVMDYYETSLKKLINEFTENEKAFSLEQICKILHDVASGLLKLQNFRIAHRDLKPQNIMISLDKKNFKIIDFGTCLLNFDYSLTAEHTVLGTFNYMAPEIKRTAGSSADIQSVYNPYAADIFSLGLIALELALVKRNMKFKFSRNINEENYEESLSKFISLTAEEYKNVHFSNLIKKMLAFHYRNRPNYEEIIVALQEIEPSHSKNSFIFEISKLGTTREFFSSFDMRMVALFLIEFSSKYFQIWWISLFFTFTVSQFYLRVIQIILVSLFLILSISFQSYFKKYGLVRYINWTTCFITNLASTILIYLIDDWSYSFYDGEYKYWTERYVVPVCLVPILITTFKEPYVWLLQKNPQDYFFKMKLIALAHYLGVIAALYLSESVVSFGPRYLKGNSFSYSYIFSGLSLLLLIFFFSKLTSNVDISNHGSEYEILFSHVSFDSKKKWEKYFFICFKISFCFGSSLAYYLAFESLSFVFLRYRDINIEIDDNVENGDQQYFLQFVLFLGFSRIIPLAFQHLINKIGNVLPLFFGLLALLSSLPLLAIILYDSGSSVINEYVPPLTLCCYEILFSLFAGCYLEKLRFKIKLEQLLHYRNALSNISLYVFLGVNSDLTLKSVFKVYSYCIIVFTLFNLLVFLPISFRLSRMKSGNYFIPV